MATVGAIINDRYRIEQPIGSGGMSTVYRAIDLKLNILYAIKEIKKNSENEIIAETSMNEVNLLKGLNNNHIPRIIDIIEDDFNVFVVQEFVQGISLEQLLETEKKFPQEIVVEWMKQMCNVLYYLHSKDIIHRDIKPGNIMYTPNSADGNEAGHITLIDFGIGRTYKKGKTKDTVAYLTEAFAAPEQKKQIGQSNPRTDIYSLGLTMYTLVTGLYPDDTIEIKKITDIDASLSTGLEKIITKCIMENPEERYQSCLELLYDLEHYKESEELYIKKQKVKVLKFSSAITLFLAFLLFAGILTLSINALEAKNYGLILEKASNQEEFENAISIDTGNVLGYKKLWEYFNEDLVITDEEYTDMNRLLVDNQSQFKGDDFAMLYYTIGQDTWFNYGGTSENIGSGKNVNDSIKSNKASSFFKTAIEYSNSKDSDYYRDSEAYLIWNDYIQAAANAQKSGKKLDEDVLRDGWRSLYKLLSSIKKSKEPIIQLKMCSQVLSAISMNVYRYKSADIGAGDLLQAVGEVNTICSSIRSEEIMGIDSLVSLKENIESFSPEVEQSIYEAYPEVTNNE